MKRFREWVVRQETKTLEGRRTSSQEPRLRGNRNKKMPVERPSLQHILPQLNLQNINSKDKNSLKTPRH